MSYNICFTLGDPSGDGHANTSEYHIVATHSVEEITNAYKKTTEQENTILVRWDVNIVMLLQIIIWLKEYQKILTLNLFLEK